MSSAKYKVSINTDGKRDLEQYFDGERPLCMSTRKVENAIRVFLKNVAKLHELQDKNQCWYNKAEIRCTDYMIETIGDVLRTTERHSDARLVTCPRTL